MRSGVPQALGLPGRAAAPVRTARADNTTPLRTLRGFHLFRNPGRYEVAHHLLGHAGVETTKRSYGRRAWPRLCRLFSAGALSRRSGGRTDF